jgi:hypothetical protein
LKGAQLASFLEFWQNYLLYSKFTAIDELNLLTPFVGTVIVVAALPVGASY